MDEALGAAQTAKNVITGDTPIHRKTTGATSRRGITGTTAQRLKTRQHIRSGLALDLSPER